MQLKKILTPTKKLPRFFLFGTDQQVDENDKVSKDSQLIDSAVSTADTNVLVGATFNFGGFKNKISNKYDMKQHHKLL